MSEPNRAPLPSDAELVEHFYGESERPQEIERALAESAELRARYAALRDLLDRIVPPAAPDAGPEFTAELWRRLEPALVRQADRTRSTFAWRVAAGLAAVLALLAGAFVLGRSSGRQDEHAAVVAQGLSQESRDRLLLAAALDHLDQSEVFLVGLKNDGAGDRGQDFALTRSRAAELVVSNRLLRGSLREAARGGASDNAPAGSRAGLSAVLEDLEPLLLEIAHAPDGLSPADLEVLRTRLRERGTLVRLRAVQDRIQRQNSPAPRPQRPGARA
jgi:hypothetical protein